MNVLDVYKDDGLILAMMVGILHHGLTLTSSTGSMRLQHHGYGIVHYSVASDYGNIHYGIASSTDSCNHSSMYPCMYMLNVRMLVMYLGIWLRITLKIFSVDASKRKISKVLFTLSL